MVVRVNKAHRQRRTGSLVGMFRATCLSVLLSSLSALLLTNSVQAQLTHTVTAQNLFLCVAGSTGTGIAPGSSLVPSNSMSAYYSGGFQTLQASGSYQATMTTSSLGFTLLESSSNLGSGSAYTGPNETLWVLSSLQPVTGTLRVSGFATTFSPFNLRTVTVDIDDDGSVEWSMSAGGVLSIPLTVNGSRSIRIISATDAAIGNVQINANMMFSVAATKEAYGTGCGAPLTLDSNVPALGTNWVLTTTGVDAISPFAVTFFGNRGPAVPFVTLGLNAPGCDAHLQSVFGSLSGANSSGIASVTVAIPSSAALIGAELSGQSVCLTSNNAALLHSSNGLEGTVGG